MSDEVLNPVEIEQNIQEVRRRIHNGVKVVTQARKAYNVAKRAYAKAFALAYLGYEGAAHERKYGAELATEDQREAMDTAEEAFKYALELSEALRDDLRALQSIGASVRAMYSTEGRS
jgi:hypothetical protein